jgi:hypothetical protein
MAKDEYKVYVKTDAHDNVIECVRGTGIVLLDDDPGWIDATDVHRASEMTIPNRQRATKLKKGGRKADGTRFKPKLAERFEVQMRVSHRHIKADGEDEAILTLSAKRKNDTYTKRRSPAQFL